MQRFLHCSWGWRFAPSLNRTAHSGHLDFNWSDPIQDGVSANLNPFVTAVWTLSNARACSRANQSKTSEFARTVVNEMFGFEDLQNVLGGDRRGPWVANLVKHRS